MPHAVFILQIEKAPTGAELAVEARYVTAYSESAAPFAFDRGRASPRCRLQFPLLPVKGQSFGALVALLAPSSLLLCVG